MSNAHPYTVIWSRGAIRDLDTILTYIATDSPQAAGKLWHRIRDRAASLATFPLRSRIVPEVAALGLADAYRDIVEDPYRVLLQIRRKEVWVVGVFDGRRDMEEILFQRLFLSK